MRSHAEICDELGGLHRELAQLESAVLLARRAHWETSAEQTVTGRTNAVNNAVADLDSEIILLKGEIRAAEYELRAREHQHMYGSL